MTDTKTYIDRISLYNTVKLCETFAANAARKGRTDLVEAANRRALEIKIHSHNVQSQVEREIHSHNVQAQVEREIIEAIYLYESVMSLEKGKKYTAKRTWPMMAKYGFIGAAARLAVKKDRAPGFRRLVAAGHMDMTFEAIIVRHPEVFEAEVVTKAKTMMLTSAS